MFKVKGNVLSATLFLSSLIKPLWNKIYVKFITLKLSWLIMMLTKQSTTHLWHTHVTRFKIEILFHIKLLSAMHVFCLILVSQLMLLA